MNNDTIQKGLAYAFSCAEAPINEKDVLSDALLDSIFDDSQYTEKKNEAIGFIAGYPSLASWRGNKLSVAFVSTYSARGNITPWRREIISRLLDMDDTPLTMFTARALDSDILCTFISAPRELAVLFHHDCPKP